jgi:hypothetical protein
MTDVVPFGKSLDLLVQQDWFKTRYANIYNVVVNTTVGEPEETPEHNRYQAMFLDEKFRIALWEKCRTIWQNCHRLDKNEIPNVAFEMSAKSGYRTATSPPADVHIGYLRTQHDRNIADANIGIRIENQADHGRRLPGRDQADEGQPEQGALPRGIHRHRHRAGSGQEDVRGVGDGDIHARRLRAVPAGVNAGRGRRREHKGDGNHRNGTGWTAAASDE